MKLTDLALPNVASASEVSHAADKFPESDLPFYRKLGRTNLTVSCLGLGGGGSSEYFEVIVEKLRPSSSISRCETMKLLS